jgi:hypothetical protein
VHKRHNEKKLDRNPEKHDDSLWQAVNLNFKQRRLSAEIISQKKRRRPACRQRPGGVTIMWNAIEKLIEKTFGQQRGDVIHLMTVACVCATCITIASMFADRTFKLDIGPSRSSATAATARPQTATGQSKLDSLEESTIDERRIGPLDAILLSQLIAGNVFITTRETEVRWPNSHPWDYMYGVDYRMQGDGDGKIVTVWHICPTTGTIPSGIRNQCSASPEFRHLNHLHTPDWKG